MSGPTAFVFNSYHIAEGEDLTCREDASFSGYSYQPSAAEYFHARHASVHVFQVGFRRIRNQASTNRLPWKMEDGIQSLAKPSSAKLSALRRSAPPYTSGKASDMALIARFYNLNQDHIFTHLSLFVKVAAGEGVAGEG